MKTSRETFSKMQALPACLPRRNRGTGPGMTGSFASIRTEAREEGYGGGGSEMATHVSAAPRRAFRGAWVFIPAVLVLVAVVGVAFAAGRSTAPNPAPARVSAQGNLGPRFTGMMPWMQGHVGDIAWMQNHMGGLAWMRSHWNQWQWMQGHTGNIGWMQTHPTQWRWMQTHMRDIGWMHDHWTQWSGWRSSMGSWSGSGSNGSGTGWNCGQWC